MFFASAAPALFFALAFALPFVLAAGETTVVPGYAERIHGEVFHYHSPLPDVDSALLVRAEDAARYIEWETAPVPAVDAGSWLRFVWMFGLQAEPDRRSFVLHVDGEPWFTFENPLTTEVRDWTIEGPRGATLRFRATDIDRFGDLMGFASLRLPASACEAGRPLSLRVVGESAGSRSWYMTFQEPIRERAALVFPPAVLAGEGDEALQPLRLELLHLGEPCDALVETSFGERRSARLEPGTNRVEFLRPRVIAPEEITVEVAVPGREAYRVRGNMTPVRPWRLDLVQHTHTDVGYTRPQTEILPEHLRFIDTALDYCDQTDDYPEDARFRWTCEISWAVREYLASRTPERIAELRRRVAEGRIEVTGMFLNLSDVVDEASYAAFLAPIRELRAHGLPVRTAMHNDINGAPWCLADYATDLGLEFLTMGQHGHRARVPFEHPTAFWWESPAGERLLAYRADHYQTGNFWGVHTGQVEAVEDELLHYLVHLERSGYPFDRVAVQHSGYPTDNSPPSTASSELVRRWNEKYLVPRLRCSTAGEFPAHVEAQHGDELETLRAAWPDWWSDGYGSAPRESAAARLTQSQLSAVESLLALERLAGLEVPAALSAQVREIRDDLLFYGEHTFGAAESIREPFSENSVVQWAEKAAYAWDAVKRSALLGEGALGRLGGLVGRGERPRLVVFNGLGFARSGLLELYVDHELWPVDRPFRLLDDTGHALGLQLLRSRAEGSYWAIAVEDVPAFGLRAWEVEVDAEGEPAPRARLEPGLGLESAHYRLEVDPHTGGLRSLFDKALERELCDPEAEWQPGQLVHETLGNREQMEAFQFEDYARVAPTDVVVEGVLRGPVWDTLRVRAELAGCEGPGGVRWEYRLHHTTKLLELGYTLQKRRVFEPESLYVAFPFALPEAEVSYDTLGGVVWPARDLIPGTATDWQVIQSFVSVAGPSAQVVLGSDQVPLVQLGGIQTGRFRRAGGVERPHVYSWVMNNYWTTNFVAASEGEYRFSYELSSFADPSTPVAARFGQGSRTPFLARLFAAGDERAPLEDRSHLELELGDLLLVAARPSSDGEGVVLHLREVAGRGASLSTEAWSEHGVRGGEVQNAIGERLRELEAVEVFAPYASRFLWLRLSERD